MLYLPYIIPLVCGLLSIGLVFGSSVCAVIGMAAWALPWVWLMLVRRIEHARLVRKIVAHTDVVIDLSSLSVAARQVWEIATFPAELLLEFQRFANSWQHRRVIAYAMRDAHLYRNLEEAFRAFDKNALTYSRAFPWRRLWWPQL